MTVMLGLIRQTVFGIRAEETTFDRRGFRGGSPAARSRLEQIGANFVRGYHAALETPGSAVLGARLAAGLNEFRGFAFEGAAMGLALLDWFTPWRRLRVSAFLGGPGEPHSYMVHVGAGWALARLPGSVDRWLDRFDPVLRWLLIDGYGFHEGFFHWPRYLVELQPAPARLRGYARHAFDQGLGRCLWFIEGADVDRIPRTIAALPAERQADLWSGVGLAAAYAGEGSQAELERLRNAAGAFLPQLAQGAAFAAKARQRARNLSAYQDLACGVLCGQPAAAAAQITDAMLENLPAGQTAPAYEIWRQRIQARFRSPAKVNL